MTQIGVAWYKREQWADLQRLSLDPVEETYEEWLAAAERNLRHLKKDGIAVERVPVDVSEMQLWCVSKKEPFDGGARSQYVALRLKGEA